MTNRVRRGILCSSENGAGKVARQAIDGHIRHAIAHKSVMGHKIVMAAISPAACNFSPLVAKWD